MIPYSWLKAVLCSALSVSVCVFVYTTWQWPFFGDAALIRYVNFLMHHGMAPYRQIVDINMPGAYAVDWLVTHLFGAGSLAWRVFDLLLIGTATVAAVAIAWPYDWFAGIYCGALLLLVHGRDGVAQMGQRDLTIAVLMISAAALLIYADRRNRWVATALFGLSCGAASTIKPTVLPLGFALLAIVAVHQKRKSHSIMPHVASGMIGLLAPPLLVLLFLLREHAVPAFIYTLRDLIPYHASIGGVPFSYFLWHTFASALLPIVLLWLAVVVIRKDWRSWERAILFVCLGFGLLSLIVQDKGYTYHRYPSEVFLLLLAGMEFTAAAQDRGLLKVLGISGLLFGVFVFAPVSTMKAARYEWNNHEFSAMLQADLDKLGGTRLSGHIQCIDTIGGCIGTLDEMRLVQSTGFLYDCYLFAPRPGPIQTGYRTRFFAEIQRNPPYVFVVTDQLCVNAPSTFNRLQTWPKFDRYLHTRYTMEVERTPPHKLRWWSHTMVPSKYRIYVVNRPAVQNPEVGSILR